MNFVTWSIRNPVPVLMIFVALVVGGLISFPRLAVQNQPDIQFPFVFVQVSYPGVPPSQMETEVTRKVEDAVASIVGIEHITSTVNKGVSSTNIEFKFGTDLSQAMDDVRDAVSRIRPDLPFDANEPYIGRATTAGDPVLTFAVASDTMTDTELSWFVDLNVIRSISGVDGVGQVTRVGGVAREVRVDLDANRMSALGVTAADVSSQLTRTQAELPGGETRIGQQAQSVRTLGTIASTQELAALPIALSGGRSVRLDAIADVRDQAADPTQLALLDGKPVIGFQVMRAWGEGAVKVADGAREAVRKLQAQYPGIHITEINSVADTRVRESFHSSMTMLIEGSILAIIVVWFFLRDMRATIISATALPLAVIPTFWALHLFGFSINFLTMLALTLVVGMLVDDAIVEVENIVRHLRMGKTPLQAASDAAIEIGLAVVATSLTLCAVFIPTAFMDGIPGQFFKPFGFTATVAVLFSLLVARTLTPMMASKFMRAHAEHEDNGPTKRWYMRHVEWALNHRKTTVFVTTGAMIASFALAVVLPKSFQPADDLAFISLSVNLPPGSRIEDVAATADKVREVAARHKEVKHVYSVVGTQRATVALMLTEVRERKISQQDLQQVILKETKAIPGARITIGNVGFGPGSGNVQFELTGDDSNLLASAAAEIERQMREVPEFAGVTTSANLLAPELVVRPRPERAAELGVTTSTLSQITRIATSGDVTTNLPKMNLPDRQVPIRVRLSDAARANIEQIRLLPVPSAGGPIPLMNVADVSFGAGPAQITRRDRSRNITVSATLASSAPGGKKIVLGEAIRIVDNLPAMKNLPAGVSQIKSGDAEFQSRIFSSFLLAMLIGILCIYALLVLLFHDVVQPVTILSALPPSVGGAFVALFLFRMELSLPSLIGLLTLMGIVTKNSILLVEYIVMARREHGMTRQQAILDACSKRVRPIVMTTIAMVAGMLPITIGLHGTSSFSKPMGAAVIGGLVASTALSLFVVPVIYTLMDDFEYKVKGWFSRGSRHVVPARPDAAQG
jgi:multidrug efflux pump subunit AcrB